MWIEPLPNGKFKAVERYEDPLTGKKKKISVTIEKNTAQTRKLAQSALNEKIKKSLSKAPVKTEYTLKELSVLYLEERSTKLKQLTITNYTEDYKNLFTILDSQILVNRLTANSVKKSFMFSDKPLQTQKSYLKAFKRLLRWGYKWDYVTDISFLQKIDLEENNAPSKKLEDKYLEADEVKLLLSKLDKSLWNVLTRFLILTGLRSGEALALTASDIDLKNRIISITKNYDSRNRVITTPKTPKSTREIYIQDELLDLCRNLKRNALQQKLICGCDLIFQYKNTYVQYHTYYRYVSRKSKDALGYQIGVHIFRHTHASLLMEKGLSIEDISHRLGHENSQITKEIYLHITEKLKQSEYDRIRKIRLI